MIVGRTEAWTGRLLLVRPDGGHDRALREPVHDGAPPLARGAARASPGRPTRSGATSWRPSTRRTWARSWRRACSSCSGVVPVVGGVRDDGRLRHRPPADPGLSSRCSSCSCSGSRCPWRASSSRSTTSCAELGIYDTKLAIILPLIGLYMPFGVFWMRAHFLGMPPEMSEAARVDGATTLDLFWRIHVPLATTGRRRRSPSCSPSGPGTSSCSPSCSWRTPPSGRWRARWVRSRASTRRTSRCWRQGRWSS